MNKQDLIQKIKQLDGLTSDEQSELINLLNTKKKYGLVWEDKPEAVEEELRTKLPVLREVVEKRILTTFEPETPPQPETPLKPETPPRPSPKGRESAGLKISASMECLKDLFSEVLIDDSNATISTPSIELPLPPLGGGSGRGVNHILIEGDNLHALTALTFTHEGKIDVMYFDPPYNTGNNDFRYNDSYVDKEDSYRHSKWLSFMSKRLKIAKKLLSDKGVIFISIDDNEQAQLKMLCDQVFGEDNMMGFFTWVRKKKGSNLSKEYRKITENLLCYKKSSIQIQLFGVKAYAEKQVPLLNRPNNINCLMFPENKIFVGKGIKDGELKKGIYGDGELTVELHQDIKISNSIIVTPFEITGRFRWSQSTVNEEISNGSQFFISNTFRINVARYNQNEKYKAPSSLITIEDGIGTNEDATEELRNIFSEKNKLPFDYPKPTSLINYVINSVTVNNKLAIILDIFAGSGTTLHATMQLNAEDGGNRQCILVTNNENNICEEVTYERNKRVIEGYSNAKGTWVEGLKGNNLRYYKSEMVSSTKTELNKRLLTQASTDLLCIKEDCYTELTESLGYNALQCRIFTNDAGKYMVVMYHSRQQWDVCSQLITTIKTLENRTENVKLYGFSPEKETLLEDFAEVADMIDAVPLPEAIYNAYRATFRTLKLDKKTLNLDPLPPNGGSN